MVIFDDFQLATITKIYIEARFPHTLITSCASQRIRLLNVDNGKGLLELRQYNDDFVTQAICWALSCERTNDFECWRRLIPFLKEEQLLAIYDRFIVVIEFLQEHLAAGVYHFQTDFQGVVSLLLVDLWADIQAGRDVAHILSKLPQPKKRRR